MCRSFTTIQPRREQCYVLQNHRYSSNKLSSAFQGNILQQIKTNDKYYRYESLATSVFYQMNRLDVFHGIFQTTAALKRQKLYICCLNRKTIQKFIKGIQAVFLRIHNLQGLIYYPVLLHSYKFIEPYEYITIYSNLGLPKTRKQQSSMGE